MFGIRHAPYLTAVPYLQMSEKGLELDCSDKQREEVRKMVEQFGAKKDEQKKQKRAQQKAQRKLDPDPLESSAAGSTIEWHELTSKTRRYTVVRESRALFVPLILDKIVVTDEQIKSALDQCGMDITSQNDALTVCAVVQADPVRVFHVQTEPVEQGKIIKTIRYIV